jgi:hypothetical protein
MSALGQLLTWHLRSQKDRFASLSRLAPLASLAYEFGPWLTWSRKIEQGSSTGDTPCPTQTATGAQAIALARGATGWTEKARAIPPPRYNHLNS